MQKELLFNQIFALRSLKFVWAHRLENYVHQLCLQGLSVEISDNEKETAQCHCSEDNKCHLFVILNPSY